MAQTVPVAPFVAPAGLNVSPIVATDKVQDRGPIWFDKVTKSTVNKASAYKQDDMCGDYSTVKVGISASINQTVECEVVSLISASISFTAAKEMSSAEITDIISNLVKEAVAKFDTTK